MQLDPPLPDRRPLVVVASVRAVAHRVFGCAAPPWVIDWKETLAELVARAWVGLVVGGVLCLLLIPIVFWPARRGRPSLYDRLGEPGWITYVFIAPVVGAILYQIAATRATVRDSGLVELPAHFYDL